MRRSLATKLVLSISILGIALPIVSVLYLAHRQSVADASQQAMAMAAEVLRRVDDAGQQAIGAYTELSKATDVDDPCSSDRIELMSDITLASSYLQLVGVVKDQQLICSSMGRPAEARDLGPVDYTSALGAQVRVSVDLGTGRDARFLLLQKGEFLTVVAPGALVDVYVDDSESSLGIYGLLGRQRMAGRGAFKLAWLDRLGDASERVFFDGSYLVALKRSIQFDTVAYAALPAERLNQRFNELIRFLLPVGILMGLGLSLGLYLLARRRGSLPAELRAGLKRREFVLHYQPIVMLDSGRIVGFEALMRWPRADGSSVRPDLFIPAAEDCGLISQFTRYALLQLQTDLPRLLQRHPDCYVSVNLAAADLQSGATVGLLQQVINQPGVTAANLIVEATEHSFIDLKQGQRVVEQIRNLGIRVAIDDFGTGYSGLSQLAHLQTDYLKIDKVFVDTVGTDSATGQVALHIIRIAESLGLRVIAEGVETEAQAEFLRQHGVEFAQGWLFHRAMPINSILEPPHSG